MGRTGRGSGSTSLASLRWCGPFCKSRRRSSRTGSTPVRGRSFEKLAASVAAQATADFDPNQPRDPEGRWTTGAGEKNSSGSHGTAIPNSPTPTPASSPFCPVTNSLKLGSDAFGFCKRYRRRDIDLNARAISNLTPPGRARSSGRPASRAGTRASRACPEARSPAPSHWSAMRRHSPLSDST